MLFVEHLSDLQKYIGNDAAGITAQSEQDSRRNTVK